MAESAITRLGKIFKKVTGVKDISMLQKNIHKHIGKLIYHKKYDAHDVVEVMKTMGMKRGSVVCIHSSMKEFYNYRGTPTELIEAIMSEITSEGTLMMPAFPNQIKASQPNFIFNTKEEPTPGGLLAETFRTMPGVVRSFNVRHSVCAWGKHAQWLIEEHHKGENCWDKNSPWFRMTELDALVFCLGLPNYYIGTFDHCVEGLLFKEHPYWGQFFYEKKTYRYYASDGKVNSYTELVGDIEKRSREKRLYKHFTSDIYKKEKLSNLLIKMFVAKPCLQIMLALGRQGITMYYVPSPHKYTF